MTIFLLSLDEIDRVKRLHGIRTTSRLAEATGLARRTWTTALADRKPTPCVLDALAALGANPTRILTAESD